MKAISLILLFAIFNTHSYAQEYHYRCPLSKNNIQFYTPSFMLNYLPAVRNISSSYRQPVAYSRFYWQQLGYFCKLEIKIEERTSIPFHFRLGSLEYTERMEGEDKP